MPEVAANATEAVLADWLVAEDGDFAADDALATVETEKAARRRRGRRRRGGAEDPGARRRRRSRSVPRSRCSATRASRSTTSTRCCAELGVAAGDGHVAVRRDVPRASRRTAGVDGSPAEEAERPPSAGDDAGAAANGRVFASPLARQLAQEAGLDVDEIDGTGPAQPDPAPRRGAAVAARTPRRWPPVAAPSRRPVRFTGRRRFTRTSRTPASARDHRARLTESKQNAPALLPARHRPRRARCSRLRAELNAGGRRSRSRSTTWSSRPSRAAHLLVPEMNVVWTDDAVRRFATVDVAVAVATERGLLTPVLRDVDGLSVVGARRAVRDLADRARGGPAQAGRARGRHDQRDQPRDVRHRGVRRDHQPAARRRSSPSARCARSPSSRTALVVRLGAAA